LTDEASSLEGGATVEGMNVAALLAGYLAVGAFALSSLAAFGVLLAGRGRAARILFAGGLLGSSLVVAGAVLTFLAPQYRSHATTGLVIVTTLSLFLSGAGQFLASLRSAGSYAVAFACTAAATFLLASPLVGADWASQLFGEFAQSVNERGLSLTMMASIVPATVSAAVGVGSLLPLLLHRQITPASSPCGSRGG
jgi:hypothetical protein